MIRSKRTKKCFSKLSNGTSYWILYTMQGGRITNFFFLTSYISIVTGIFCQDSVVYIFQNMNASGFRVCVKELYETRYDPVSVSYAVFTGQ